MKFVNIFVNYIKVLVEMKNGSILLFLKKANLKEQQVLIQQISQQNSWDI